MEKNLGGRPSLYNEEELLQRLIEYRQTFDGKITYSGLEKATGVKRHIWRDNKFLNAKIEEFNKIDLGLNNIDLSNYTIQSLPSVETLVDRFYSNKDALIAALQDYDGFVKRLFNMCNDYYRSHKELKKANSDIEILKGKITEIENERDFYKNEYLKLTVLSESPTARKDNNIKNNVIKLNKKEVAVDVDSLEGMFDDFDI